MPVSFSALLSVYKNDATGMLDECLQSLNNQTWPLEEVIVVQEGEVSAELTACLEKWSQLFGERFSWYKLPYQNGPMGYGLPKCLNYGIEHAKSDYIMRLDTDDISLPTRVEEQKKFAAANPDIKLFGCVIQEFDEAMTVIGKKRDVPYEHAAILRRAKYRSPFNGQTVVFDKAVALRLGGYPNIPSNEDYCFWAAFIMNGYKTANMNKVLVNVRAGQELIFRRSSKRYRQGEAESLKYLHSIGFLNTWMYLFHRTSKRVVRSLPDNFITFIYNRFLRS